LKIQAEFDSSSRYLILYTKRTMRSFT
jgi:hypothetical protein